MTRPGDRTNLVTAIAGFLAPSERALLEALAKELPFVPGRQGTGYEKADVAARPELRSLVARALAALGAAPDAPHDAWLLRYQVGTHIPPHRDPVEAGEHHRLNAVVTAATGGDATVSGETLALAVGDAYVFRPDVLEHEVAEITAGTRLVFSVGILREA